MASCTSSTETIAVNCLVFEKTAFCVRVSGDRKTDEQTINKRKKTDGHRHRVKCPLAFRAAEAYKEKSDIDTAESAGFLAEVCDLVKSGVDALTGIGFFNA